MPNAEEDALNMQRPHQGAEPTLVWLPEANLARGTIEGLQHHKFRTQDDMHTGSPCLLPSPLITDKKQSFAVPTSTLKALFAGKYDNPPVSFSLYPNSNSLHEKSKTI